MLIGRTSRSEDAWNARVKLAEALGARVITDLKVGASFPTDHPLHLGAPSVLTPDAEGLAALAKSDVILSLDWVDLAGTLKAAKAPAASAKVISVTMDHQIHNGWSMDHQGFAPVDVLLAADPEHAVPLLIDALSDTPKRPAAVTAPADAKLADGPLTVEHLARALRDAVGDKPVSLTHLPLSWHGAWWPFRHPLDFLGSDGGGGLGAGPGVTVGAALALKGSGRIPVGICGDGDFLMGATALWTAAHYRIPLLIVVANNRSFYNDEVHQERVARMRNRPVENKWIGQRISDPDIDLAQLAHAQGARGFGPVEDVRRLEPMLAEAVAVCRSGRSRGRRRARCAGLYARDDGRRVERREEVLMAVTRLDQAARAQTAEPVLVVDDIVKSFETPDGIITAVDHISFTVAPGEFLAVIGPSGCGKSTLFNIIGGLLDGYEGRVAVTGETVTGPHASIGMVFQEESTFPWRTVTDNVAFPLEIAGQPKAQRVERARHFIDLVGLTGFENRYPAELSGGMRQRVAIARTLASEPKILLMDEPFGALDEQTRLLLGDKVLQIQDQLQADLPADHPQHHRGRATCRPRAGDDLPARQGEAHGADRTAAPALLRNRVERCVRPLRRANLGRSARGSEPRHAR